MKDWKNTLKRAIKTFIQAAIAYAAANIAGIVGGAGIKKVALAGLLVSAFAAGLAALLNLPDHAGKADGVEYVEGPAVTKRIDESLDDIPMAGQDEPGEELPEEGSGEGGDGNG